ncbi:hypothetical protein RclHR1_03070014 [Rhizophagus clarus]|nr:hypothetical protein RclHR1_03070014 [Rhizophagus clarus]
MEQNCLVEIVINISRDCKRKISMLIKNLESVLDNTGNYYRSTKYLIVNICTVYCDHPSSLLFSVITLYLQFEVNKII